jgi:methylmalonyl-CoA mutase
MQNLFTEFPNISYEEWKEKVTKDLKGRAFEELQWQLGKDIMLDPFYSQENAGQEKSFSLSSKSDNDWQIAEDFIIGKDLKKDNQLLLESLLGGINAPRLFLDRDYDARAFEVLFKEVAFDFISIHFVLSENVDSDLFFDYFNTFLIQKDKDISKIKGSVSGCEFQEYFLLKTIAIDTTPFYGSDIPKELAKSIKLGVDLIMSSADEKNLSKAFESILFSIKIGKSYFPSIAKIRALKILWARICKGFDLDFITPEIEVNFSDGAYGENKNNNMIRATTMAMAASIGGADRIIVLPSDVLEQQPNAFSRRIARNVQHLLKMESAFDKVIDPSAGSYYIEKMTNIFVEKAWTKFLENEKS